MITNNFKKRHIGPGEKEIGAMLAKIGVSSIDDLITKTVPASIRLKEELKIGDGMNEYEYIQHLKAIGQKNKIYKSYIGMGYYNTITPGVITRNVLENPGWYTAYTPYQAEISQGRLEAILNFQTMISDLTAMPMSNASLLDEATAASEAMIMAFNARSRKKAKSGANKFFVSESIFPQTKDVLITRSTPLQIELVFGNFEEIEFDDKFFGAIVQYPNETGKIENYAAFADKCHENSMLLSVVVDLMALALLTPPGEWGADIVVGNTQRFGVPMGYGGPHAAYLASKEEFKRHMPGRIIGISIDKEGNPALRMALQTREQHIKRERATSNICTAQALLAIMAQFYAAYHGPEGIKDIAKDINNLAGILSKEIEKYGYKQLNDFFFDTLHIELADGVDINVIREKALKNQMNFRYIDEKHLGISIDETTTLDDINTILSIFAEANNKSFEAIETIPGAITTIPEDLTRTSQYLTHPVFNSYHSETEMMRYMKKLENRDLALNRTMIPLGSCTMKLNPATSMFHLSWPEFGSLHPFIPQDQALGYYELIDELRKDLLNITGFDSMSFQPNSGSAGEYTGLLVIREYLKSRGEEHRNVCLIPASAHGTNPASAAMANMKIVVVKCDDEGNVDVEDLRTKAEQNKENLAAVMITYPSTHGVFEEGITEIINIIHENGGQVYMDGANMNAQVGLTNPGFIGADVCHLNLHKTFAIPHGGGGPGVGPIGVAKHLTPFLPSHSVVPVSGEKAIKAVAAAQFGSASILPITYAYIKMLGGKGLKKATEMAIFNANYMKACLNDHYKILYTDKNGHVGHEMIIDCNEFHHTANVTVSEIAKRMMDFGIHAPTVAFPVIGTLMVEPTESEPLSEMNRFVEAMIQIREEIKAIEEGKADKKNNPIKNAPHTNAMCMAEEWTLPYSRKEAAFPLGGAMTDKYWPTVAKIDDGYGDRNLFCTCAPIQDFE